MVAIEDDTYEYCQLNEEEVLELIGWKKIGLITELINRYHNKECPSCGGDMDQDDCEDFCRCNKCHIYGGESSYFHAIEKVMKGGE